MLKLLIKLNFNIYLNFNDHEKIKDKKKVFNLLLPVKKLINNSFNKLCYNPKKSPVKIKKINLVFY